MSRRQRYEIQWHSPKLGWQQADNGIHDDPKAEYQDYVAVLNTYLERGHNYRLVRLTETVVAPGRKGK